MNMCTSMIYCWPFCRLLKIHATAVLVNSIVDKYNYKIVN